MEELFKCMGEIDDEILERSENTVKIKHSFMKKPRRTAIFVTAAAAAAIVFAIIGVAKFVDGIKLNNNPMTYPINGSIPYVDEVTVNNTIDNTAATAEIITDLPTTEALTYEDINVCYNYIEEGELPLSVDRVHIAGYFSEELSAEMLRMFIPTGCSDYVKYDYTGTAGFDGKGNLLEVYLDIKHKESGKVILVGMSQGVSGDMFLEDADRQFLYNDLEYTAYEYDYGQEGIKLSAVTYIGDIRCDFSVTALPEESEETVKAIFENVLVCFSMYDEKPLLSEVVPSVIPEWQDEKISLSEALSDENFGKYLPVKQNGLPKGFVEESIRRSKDQNWNYLSGLWCRGYDEISFRVSYLEENDEERIISIEENEKYDLNLYPIPRAESVPESLREVVDNPIFKLEELTLSTVYKRAYTVNDRGDTSGYRMNFSVLIDNVVITVRTKGVEPEWVYEALINLVK